MDKIDINELIKTATSALDLTNFKGDVVMYKHVEKEMNIAEGGIGEQHIHYGNDGKRITELVKEPSRECDETTSDKLVNTIEIPQSVKDVFVQPAFIESYVRAMMTNYYDSKPLSLALIYCVLKDYSLIRSVGDYQKFVRALIDWQMLSTMDEKQVKTLADGVSAYMRDRNDHGKIRSGLTSDFRNWTDAKKRQQCEAIASVFGKEDDYLYPEGTIHYKYKKK